MTQKTKNQIDHDFFQIHSLKFIEMALDTQRMERVDNPDGYGKRIGECGDTVEFFIRCRNSIIDTVSFWIKGCVHTVACSNAVARFAEGKTIEAAWELTPEKVADFLETLPEDHFHCAELATGALYLALADIKNAKQN